MSKDDAPACENCRYWVRAIARTNWPPAGECRRHPPEAVTSHFPNTKPDDWCGEHEAVTEPLPKVKAD